MDIYPLKSQFNTNETVILCLEWDKELPIKITLKIYSLAEVVKECEFDVNQINIHINLGKFDASLGYGVCVFTQNNTDIPILQTAFDVTNSPHKFLRYGFLSDFTTKDYNNNALKWLLKCHINIVQFYDWSYRHDDFISPEDDYQDMMGKEISANTIRKKIVDAKSLGMHPIAYGAVYAASMNFFAKHPKWAFYNSCGDPFVFIDIFYIMNIIESSPWRAHLLKEYQKAISIMGFEGIHMDTYGFPKTAYSHLNKKPELVRLENSLPTLIDEISEELICENKPYLIFNNVGAWPVHKTADQKQDAVYIEVWPPYDRYSSIAELIRYARYYARDSKSIIIAAYLKPFRDGDRTKALPAARLLMGTVVSCGATHLFTGENQAVLTQGYYSDYSRLSIFEADIIRRYYDYMIRYSNLFYDEELQNVSMTHTGWDNYEYQTDGHNISSYGESDKIWMIIREKKFRKCIYLINLCGQTEDYWNNGKVEPLLQENIKFAVQVDFPVSNIFFSTPDENNLNATRLTFIERNTKVGKIIEFILPRLKYWSTIWIDMKTDN